MARPEFLMEILMFCESEASANVILSPALQLRKARLISDSRKLSTGDASRIVTVRSWMSRLTEIF